MYKLKVLSLILFLLATCVNAQKTAFSRQVIKRSCELESRINDTLIISGVYSTCMEYSSFLTIRNDPCKENFNMYLNFNATVNGVEIIESIYTMQACNAYKKMTLRGILKKGKKSYGHLGTNSCELLVLEIIKHKKIRYK